MGVDTVTDAEPGAASGDVMVPRPFRVEGVRRDTHDTVTLDLRPLDGAGLAFGPGQFTMVQAFGLDQPFFQRNTTYVSPGPNPPRLLCARSAR